MAVLSLCSGMQVWVSLTYRVSLLPSHCACPKPTQQRPFLSSGSVSMPSIIATLCGRGGAAPSLCCKLPLPASHPVTVLYASHSSARQSHFCTPVTLLHASHTSARQSHFCTPVTLLHTSHTSARMLTLTRLQRKNLDHNQGLLPTLNS